MDEGVCTGVCDTCVLRQGVRRSRGEPCKDLRETCLQEEATSAEALWEQPAVQESAKMVEETSEAES